jgi:protein tyrosine kinase modulator
MLERQSYQEHRMEEDIGQVLSPSYFYEILKRRALFFLIPFLLILAIGSLITAVWPAIYLSQGTILVQSQEIPSDLVRPTVGALANDRIQVIEQRIMTRDNLVAIAKKFQLSPGWQERVSGTEIVDFIRKRAIIKPAELKLQGQRKDAIAYTVGFEYERPEIAAKVANELVTMILDEDVRSRTGFAAETTKFLAQEVKRLENQLSLNDAQISELKSRAGGVPSDESAAAIAALKAELLAKSATYSDSHPDIIALKRKIAALEKSSAATNAKANTALSRNTVSANSNPIGLDSLQTQRLSIKDELNKATQKLSAARLGENLERGQHSERLEVIEQPTMPQKPISPNRPKLFGIVIAIALMAGGGSAFGVEMLNQSIRRKSDLFSLIDSHLIVTVPYISTRRELQRKKNRFKISMGIAVAVVLAGLVILIYVLPPLDVLFDKIIKLLAR